MKLKTLLLGSATVFAVGGAAQAADLSIAEPVDYVRVCDAFGVGYWYIPGTDTCIHIGGRVRFQVNFHENAETAYNYNDGSHSSTWHFTTNAQLSAYVRSLTEYGELAGFVKLTGTFNDPTVTLEQYYDGEGPTSNALVYVDEAWLQLGMLKAGKWGSVQDTDGGYDDWGGYHPDVGVQQIALSWAAAGFGIMLGIEDPRYRFGSDLPNDYTMPDITARLTASLGHVDARVTAGWGEVDSSVGGGVWGIAGTLETTMDPISLRVGGAIGSGAKFVNNVWGQTASTTYWGAFASISGKLGPTLTADATVAYTAENYNNDNSLGVGADLVWKPVSGFSATLAASGNKKASDATWGWNAFVRLQRDW
jgi:hypothetical protein